MRACVRRKGAASQGEREEAGHARKSRLPPVRCAWRAQVALPCLCRRQPARSASQRRWRRHALLPTRLVLRHAESGGTKARSAAMLRLSVGQVGKAGRWWVAGGPACSFCRRRYSSFHDHTSATRYAVAVRPQRMKPTATAAGRPGSRGMAPSRSAAYVVAFLRARLRRSPVNVVDICHGDTIAHHICLMKKGAKHATPLFCPAYVSMIVTGPPAQCYSYTQAPPRATCLRV